MIRQGMATDSILEKKFKILRTSILLGSDNNRSDLLYNYELAARDIDKMKQSIYEEILASKMYITTSLEDERERLKDLIAFIESRINERNEFTDDYIKVTNNFLDNLPRISNESNLPDYRERLNNINEYLNNSHEIEIQNSKLVTLRDSLREKYENKANNEIINTKLEDELIDEFNKIITRDDYYSSLNYTDIDSELSNLLTSIDEKKGVMDTFVSSYNALKDAGISGSEKDEYLSYVRDSQNDYYSDLERQYILNIYKLVLDKENTYDLLYQKRFEIDNILKDRANVRKSLMITSPDYLEFFSNLCNEQFSVIKAQKFNLEDIDKLVNEIKICEDRLAFLENANKRKEIVSLLTEFSEKAPETVKIDLPDEKEIFDEVSIQEVSKTAPRANNEVVKVREPIKMNTRVASDMAKSVMKRVVVALDPKKYEDKMSNTDNLEKEDNIDKDILEAPSDNAINGDDELNTPTDAYELKEDSNGFIDLDFTGLTASPYDDVFVDGIPEVTLDTSKQDDELSNNIDLNVVSDDNIVSDDINDSDSKKVDLFSETDPFLDDNRFEVNSETDKNGDGALDNMPSLNKIGTVKPNSVLSQIEEVVKDNSDIVMPTLGITDNDKQDVPIVSENYIN